MEGFILNVTKLLSQPPYPSRKQSKIFISSSSNLFFFSHSRFSPQKTIRLFELKLTVEPTSQCVFWTSFRIVAVLQCWASYPLFCWVCWTKRFFLHYRIFLHFSPKRCHWIWTWIECRNNQRFDMWSKHGPVWRVNHPKPCLQWEEGGICSFLKNKMQDRGLPHNNHDRWGVSRSHRLKKNKDVSKSFSKSLELLVI